MEKHFYYMGYSGTYELARKAAKIISNTSFVRKVSRNLSLPFRPGWFEENPYENIKNEKDSSSGGFYV